MNSTDFQIYTGSIEHEYTIIWPMKAVSKVRSPCLFYANYPVHKGVAGYLWCILYRNILINGAMPLIIGHINA